MAVKDRVDYTTDVKTTQRTGTMDIRHNVNSFLGLCGPECLDVQHALTTGVITHDIEHLIAVERDKDWAREMKGNLRVMGFKPIVHDGELHTLQLKTLLPNGLDYAYLDFCGLLSANVCDWISRQLTHVLRKGSFVSITLMRRARNHHFIKLMNNAGLFVGYENERFLPNLAGIVSGGCDKCKLLRASGQRITQCGHMFGEKGDKTQLQLALLRLSLYTCGLSCVYFEQYVSEGGENSAGGTPMMAATFRVTGTHELAVPKPMHTRFQELLAMQVDD